VRAARHLLNQQQAVEFSPRQVVRAAGLGLQDFYDVFRSKDELLVALGRELLDELRGALLEARHRSLRSPDDEQRTREQFERAVRFIAANPAWFHLSVRSEAGTPSPLGRAERYAQGNLRQDLVRELVDRGYPNETPADTRRLMMMADCYIAMTECLAQGHLEGWYPELDEILEVLILFTRGPRDYRLARRRNGRPTAPRRRG
jgi:AcrR family transcriptional regulator